MLGEVRGTCVGSGSGGGHRRTVKKFLTFLKREVITRSIIMYCCYYKCFQAQTIVKYFDMALVCNLV